MTSPYIPGMDWQRRAEIFADSRRTVNVGRVWKRLLPVVVYNGR